MSHTHHRKTKTSQSGGFIDSDIQSGNRNGHGLSFSHNSSITSSECGVSMLGSGLHNPLVIDGELSSSGLGRTAPYSFKNLGQLQFGASPKFGHAATPAKETEAMRKWKEIKQNGFLSHPHGGIPIPLPQPSKRSNRKEKSVDHKKKVVEPAKSEQEIRLKTAPCSGLLSQINTGIIRRVKNYKEVHAMLEAVVRLEKPVDQLHNELICHVECRGEENNDTMPCHNHFSQSVNRASAPFLDQRGKSIMAEHVEERPHLEAAITACCSYKELPSVTPSHIATEKF